MLKVLVKLANRLDSLGLTKEADVLDREILKIAAKSSAPTPNDEDVSVQNLEKIVNLDSYDRWRYMTKDDAKNTSFIQDYSGPVSETQKGLIEKVFELCGEDFSRESEFEERAAVERLAEEPKLSDYELKDLGKRIGLEDKLPDYHGRGVSMFRDPNVLPPLLESDIDTDRDNRYSLSVHKKPELRDSDIFVRDLELSGITPPVRSKDDSSLRMSPEDKARFDSYLESQLIERSGQKDKKDPAAKSKRINDLKDKIKELRDFIEEKIKARSDVPKKSESELTEKEKREKEAERKELIEKINTLDSLTNSLTAILTGSRVSSENEAAQTESGKNLSEYTVEDIEPSYYYVFQLMKQKNKNKKFWIAMGEFEEEQQAIELSDLLDSQSGDEDSTMIVNGLDAKDLVYSGDARFRLEGWSEAKIPHIRKEKDSIRERLDPEKQEGEGFGIGGLSGFGGRNI